MKKLSKKKLKKIIIVKNYNKIKKMVKINKMIKRKKELKKTVEKWSS